MQEGLFTLLELLQQLDLILPVLHVLNALEEITDEERPGDRNIDQASSWLSWMSLLSRSALWNSDLSLPGSTLSACENQVQQVFVQEAVRWMGAEQGQWARYRRSTGQKVLDA